MASTATTTSGAADVPSSPSLQRVQIRDAKPGTGIRSDAAAIYDIYKTHAMQQDSFASLTETPPTIEDWSHTIEELLQGSFPFLVATFVDDGGRTVVAGFACAKQHYPKRTGYRYTVEHSIYVGKAFSNLSDSKGIGGKLMHALIEACRGRGFRSILAIIGSAGSVRFHKRHGFRFCGELLGVGWRWGKWSDVAYMQLDLRTDEVPGTGQYASGNAGLKAAYYEDTAAMMAAVTEAVTRRLEHKRSDSSDDSPDLSSWSRAEPASSTTTTLTTKYTESSSKHVGRLGSLLLGAALGAGAMAALAWAKRD